MPGEIEVAPQRALTHLIGHDEAGYFGRQSFASLRALAGALPANVADYPLRSADEYYGQVATNCRIATAQATDGISTFSRCHHTLRAEVTELAVRMPNWFVYRSADKFETAIQGQTSFSMSIEYPAGTLHLLTFDGKSQGSADMGAEICSDFLPISLPAGAQFWVRVSTYSMSGYPYALFRQNDYVAEGSTYSTSRITDRTRYISSDPGSRSVGTWPLGVVARTTHGGVLGIGDSIVQGTGDSFDAADTYGTGDGFGLVGRAVSGSRAYINAGVAGDNLGNILDSYRQRLSLARYVKNIVFEHGVNNIANTDLATIKAQMLALWTHGAQYRRPGARLFQTTITPSTISTDSFATLANQTAATGFSTAGNGTRELLNDWLRDGAPVIDGAPAAIGASGADRAGDGVHPLHAVFDVADAVESSRNSGKWKVDGTANKYTGDGLHPNRAGNLLVAASGAIDVTAFA